MRAITLNDKEIIEILSKDDLKIGIERYIKIMENLNKVDVSKDKDFQKSYNHFYRMRQRNFEYYNCYFDYMEKSKTKKVTFEEVINYIYEKCGRCETSFSSKFIATIDPSKPIWDSVVIKNIGIRVPYSKAKDRLNKIVSAYDELCYWYENFMKTDKANLMISLFDEYYSDVNITDIKKVDFIYWQKR